MKVSVSFLALILSGRGLTMIKNTDLKQKSKHTNNNILAVFIHNHPGENKRRKGAEINLSYRILEEIMGF